MADFWCSMSHFILPPQRKLTALNEHIEQPRTHSILLCTLAILFLIFQNISPINTLIVPEDIKLQPIQCFSKEKINQQKTNKHQRNCTIEGEEQGLCLFISLFYSRGDKCFVSVPGESSWYELWNVKYN